jgi:4-amino-4-deoxy-L-arabinose transferase-like glycosyltransferase
MIKSVEWRIPILIALGAFALRIVVVLAFQAHQIDEDWNFGFETGRIARALVEGEGFSSPFRVPSGPTAWFMPAYPAILALVFVLFGTYSVPSAITILTLNSIFAALTCVAVYLLAKKVFGHPTAIVAAIALALYPPSVWHSVNTIWDTSLLALLVVLLIYRLYDLDGNSGLGSAALYGLVLGLVVWVNPIVLCFLPLVWLRIWGRFGGSARRRLAAVALATLTVTVVIGPWLMRNHQQFGRPYLRSNLGLELKLGNSAAAWRGYLEGQEGSPWLRGHPSVVSEELERFVMMGEAAYVQEALGDALTFIREHPAKFLRLSLRRVYIFWLSDLAGQNEWSGNLKISVPLSWMRKACHLAPLPFVLLGLVAATRRKLDVEPLVGFMVLFPIVYYLTHVSERYRFPLEPVLVVLASYGLVLVLERVGLRMQAK